MVTELNSPKMKLNETTKPTWADDGPPKMIFPSRRKQWAEKNWNSELKQFSTEINFATHRISRHCEKLYEPQQKMCQGTSVGSGCMRATCKYIWCLKFQFAGMWMKCIRFCGVSNQNVKCWGQRHYTPIINFPNWTSFNVSGLEAASVNYNRSINEVNKKNGLNPNSLDWWNVESEWKCFNRKSLQD